MSVVFGIMTISFPIGAYLVYNSEIGRSINFQYPLKEFSFFVAGIGYKIPVTFQLGDAFIIAWSAYVVLFSVSYAGPLASFTRNLAGIMSEGLQGLRENGLVSAITWFSVIILSSIILDFVQNIFGVRIEPPQFQNGLTQFFQITVAPLTEEIGFRALLIGVPLFLMFSHRASLKLFFKSLWRPAAYLEAIDYRKAMTIIIAVGIFFGVAHIISGNPWSPGKITQAALGGIILGWVYVRHGLAPAILVHWGTNYFVYSYLFFISVLGHAPLSSEISNPFSDTLEQLLLVTGALSLAIMAVRYAKERNEKIQRPA